jgi:hypothetical protein
MLWTKDFFSPALACCEACHRILPFMILQNNGNRKQHFIELIQPPHFSQWHLGNPRRKTGQQDGSGPLYMDD